MSLPSARSILRSLVMSRLRVPRDVARFAFRRYSDQLALITSAGQWTYAELANRVFRLADSWTTLGLGSGDMVFTMMSDGNEQVEVGLALAEIGAIRGSFHGSHSDDLVLDAARDTQPKIFVYDQAVGGAMRDRLVELIPGLITVQIGPGGDYEKSIAAGRPRRSTQRVVPTDPATLGFTSGTTGPPKGIFNTWEKSIISLKLMAANMQGPQGNGDLMMVGVPLGGAGGGFVLPMLLSGSVLVVPPDYEMTSMLPLIERLRVTRLFATPSLLIDLLDSPELAQRDLGALRNVIYGSAPMPAKKMAEALRRFGPIFQQGYGMAEVLPPVGLLQMDQHMRDGEPADDAVLNSVGYIIPQVSVQVVDEQKQPLATGATGRIMIKSPTVFPGYWRRPELTEQTLRDGWMVTNDFGYFDTDQRLHILDRESDLITCDGRVVYPRQIEELCHAHPGVKEACLVQIKPTGSRLDATIGSPDGEVVLALSPRRQRPDGKPTGSDDVLAKEVLDLIADQFEPWQLPSRVLVLPELPRSFLRKVLRREIRDLLTGVRR